jgi:COMPASS component SWD1
MLSLYTLLWANIFFFRNSFLVTAVSWNKAGTRIYTGTSKGYLNIIDVESNKITYSTRITNTTIKGIQWSRNGRYE